MELNLLNDFINYVYINVLINTLPIHRYYILYSIYKYFPKECFARSWYI